MLLEMVLSLTLEVFPRHRNWFFQPGHPEIRIRQIPRPDSSEEREADDRCERFRNPDSPVSGELQPEFKKRKHVIKIITI